MKCPVCTANLSYLATRSVTPSMDAELRECPDPDCEVGRVTVVHEV